MLSERITTAGDPDNQKSISHSGLPYRRSYSLVLWVLFIGFVVFLVWASFFKIDQVARTMGEVIARSRVQIIQSVDGGVLAELNVKEGDSVEAGQVLASLDQTRVLAAVREVEVRLLALKAKAARLRAEVTGQGDLVFSESLQQYPDLIAIEQALYDQRRKGLKEELESLKVAVDLAKEEADLLAELASAGDVNQLEAIRAAQASNEANGKYINRKNKFLEDARIDLAETEDEIAQNMPLLTQRKHQLEDSVFKALLPGIVKNVRVTTIGGVLRAGEELMQIIPVGDELVVEAKVLPGDIAQVRPGLEANIRFDPFDYTVFGSVTGIVTYVSADTLKEESSEGKEVFYRVHAVPVSYPVVSTINKELEILPGMTAQVDIRTGERTLMNYLLKPLRKTLAESLGEQ